MRPLILVLAVLCSGLWISACSQSQKSKAGVEQAKVYTCPSCKETVTWMYNDKGLPTGHKKVTHTCPSCKKTWGANLTTTSTCADCGKEHLACPVCREHGA